jgi:alkanesulfonate monooxygenase SsuD/methylene tetrahydromethanopterin reductase-like flavin-dependent oxidoreductase (luciferase family)
MLKTAMGKQLYRSRVARSAVVPERSLRSSGSPWAKARDDFGRQIDVMTYGLVVCRETEKETKDAFQEVLYDGDGGAAGNVIKIALSGASQSFDHAREMSERFIAGWGGYPLVGTPEQVVEGMKQLGETAGYDPRCGPWAEHPVG